MHAYPAQLADFVMAHWPATMPLGLGRRALSELLSTCFQASLGHEEGRAVRFRLIAASVTQMAEVSQPDGFLQLEFSEPTLLTPDNVTRLSPAAPFHASSLAASEVDGSWTVWGLVHTGPAWLAPTWGGRPGRHDEIRFPMLHVLGPGRLAVYAGAALVASLERGVIEATTTDVFSSNWLSNLFLKSRSEATAQVERDARALRVNEAVVRVISQHMVRRAIFLIRSAGHGGLILFAEPNDADAWSQGKTGPLKFKYAFRNNDSRTRYRTLLKRLLRAVGERDGAEIDLQRFLDTETREVMEIEQSIFELSRLVSGLAEVDGAVVLNKRFELIGFGAEVSGELPYPDIVFQALDVEAERRAPEPANSVGTRHRAAYRFVAAHPTGLAVVISHDGIVRFVANANGDVVYWDQFLNW